MNGINKNRGRDNLTKSAGPSVIEIVKTQLKVVEIENVSLCTHR